MLRWNFACTLLMGLSLKMHFTEQDIPKQCGFGQTESSSTPKKYRWQRTTFIEKVIMNLYLKLCVWIQWKCKDIFPKSNHNCMMRGYLIPNLERTYWNQNAIENKTMRVQLKKLTLCLINLVYKYQSQIMGVWICHKCYTTRCRQ